MLRAAAIASLGGLSMFAVGGPLSTSAWAAPPGNNGRVAFVQTNSGGDTTLYTSDSDGSRRAVVPGSGNGSKHPTWSPDGSTLAFVRGDFRIVLHNFDSGVTSYIAIPYEVFRMGWSPDGTRLAFEGGPPGAPSADIYTVDVAGRSVVRLTEDAGNFNIDPTWSPDSSRIAWASWYLSGASHLDIYTMNADGTDKRRLTFTEDRDEQLPSWSPDGQRIAFEAGGDLWVMGADGSSPSRITADERWEGEPDWSPDGSRIGFSLSTTPDTSMFRTISPSGADNRGMLNPGSSGTSVRQMAWQPVAVAPTASGVSPATITEGSAPIAITVVGAGFSGLSTVLWNGVPRPSRYLGRDRLSASIPATDLASAGTAAVNVRTSGFGGGTSNTLRFTIQGAGAGGGKTDAPAATITKTVLNAKWRLNRVFGSLRVSGSLERAATMELALMHSGAVSMRRSYRLPGGRFTRTLPLERNLAPGRYVVRLRERARGQSPRLVTATKHILLAAPPDGYVRSASMSTTGPSGPAAARDPEARALFARFMFAPKPKRGRTIVTRWFHEGRLVVGTTIRRPRSSKVGAMIRSSAPLAPGRWSCVISVGGRTLVSTTIRLG